MFSFHILSHRCRLRQLCPWAALTSYTGRRRWAWSIQTTGRALGPRYVGQPGKWHTWMHSRSEWVRIMLPVSGSFIYEQRQKSGGGGRNTEREKMWERRRVTKASFRLRLKGKWESATSVCRATAAPDWLWSSIVLTDFKRCDTQPRVTTATESTAADLHLQNRPMWMRTTGMN